MQLTHKQQILLGVALIVACVIIAGYVDQRLSVRKLLNQTEGFLRYSDNTPKPDTGSNQ